MRFKYLTYNISQGVKKAKTRTAMALSSLALVVSGGGVMAFANFGAAHAATPWYVSANSVGGGSCASPDFNSVGTAAASASAGETIVVCAGTYNEDVSVSKSLTFVSENNEGVRGNSAARGAESILNGLFTVNAANVMVDGLSFTHEELSGSVTALLVKTVADNLVVTNSVFDGVGSGSGNVQALYLENGPDGATITRNLFQNVHAVNSSAKAVFAGDSTSTDPSTGATISRNVFRDITSSAKGAYGVLVNTGNGGVENSSLEVTRNNFARLTGGWVHAVGLEADTPNAVVAENNFGRQTSSSADNINVWFEGSNPSYATAKVNFNNFNRVNVIGIAVGFAGVDALDGTCNYWGDSTGPGLVAAGSGAFVSPLVDYQPWLTSRSGDCDGGVPKQHMDCFNDGWKDLVTLDGQSFKNQGQCVSYVNHNDGNGMDDVKAKKN